MNITIDRKFKILAVNPCKSKVTYTEKDGVFFTAKDAALIPTLTAYHNTCKDMGCDSSHLDSISLLIERVRFYQETVNKKIPDTETVCEMDRCIGGIGVEED